MSYPREIQTLIVEDDDRPKRFYDALFSSLANEKVNPPRYAFCYEDAEKALQETSVFHLVILDMRLPERPRQPPSDQLEFGLALLNRCIQRDDYPLPALLIISGQLAKASNQTELEAKVRDGFAYGRVVTKGDGGNENDIREAVRHVHRYSDVGVHLKDSGENIFPTLSPREEDLLRRCVLAHQQFTGMDLKWWSAAFARPTGPFAAYKGWNKVLTGRFLMSDGKGLSRPMFFKFFPTGGAEVVLKDAHVLQTMLPHIKVVSGISSGNRSLLVTEKIGSSNADPVPLDAFLARPMGTVQPALGRILQEVSAQLAAFGNSSPNQLPLRELLWKDHNEDQLATLLAGYSPEKQTLTVSPDEIMKMLRALRKNDSVVRIEQCLCHGDLNFSNVALDVTPDAVHGYIIDPAGMRRVVNVWDLATLEITSILHQGVQPTGSLAVAAAPLYAESVAPAANLNFNTDLPVIGNTLKLVSEIRLRALEMSDPKIYALMLFDVSLIQVGGLPFRSQNKIQNPSDAVFLASQAARLLRAVAPEWLPI